MSGKWEFKKLRKKIVRKVKTPSGKRKVEIVVKLYGVNGTRQDPKSYTVEVTRNGVEKDSAKQLGNLGMALDVRDGYVIQAGMGTYDTLGN